MSEEELDEQVASESETVEPTEEKEEAVEEPKMVPLTALQAERKKRQEIEARARVYEEMMNRQKEEPQEEEDPDQLLTKGSYSQDKSLTKREILEQVYQDMNPKAVQKIETYLKPILDKKPWLASSIEGSVNRLVRASEIVDDYMHLIEPKKARTSPAYEAKKIVENSEKPRSPADVSKSANLSGMDYLKSIQGKKEFREYRQKMLRGEA